MKVGLVGYGTRGDVQPFVCLGDALSRRGHEVRLLVPRNGAQMSRAAGLPTVELPLDVQQMFNAPAAQRMLAAGRIGAFFRWLHREEKAFLAEFRAVLVEGLGDRDAIVCHPLVEDRCAAIAEMSGAAVVSVHFFPVLPSSHFPSPFIAQRSLGPLNRATHRFMLRMLWRLSHEEVAAMRRDLARRRARAARLQPDPVPRTGGLGGGYAAAWGAGAEPRAAAEDRRAGTARGTRGMAGGGWAAGVPRLRQHAGARRRRAARDLSSRAARARRSRRGRRRLERAARCPRRADL